MTNDKKLSKLEKKRDVLVTILFWTVFSPIFLLILLSFLIEENCAIIIFLITEIISIVLIAIIGKHINKVDKRIEKRKRKCFNKMAKLQRSTI